jgi:hypothetical protein
MNFTTLCKYSFKLSDVVSGGIFVLSIFGFFFSFLLPPLALVVAAITQGISIGAWGLIYVLAFLSLTFLTFRHYFPSVIGHIILVLFPVFIGGSISYLYVIILFIFICPYVIVGLDVSKHNKPFKQDK